MFYCEFLQLGAGAEIIYLRQRSHTSMSATSCHLVQGFDIDVGIV